MAESFIYLFMVLTGIPSIIAEVSFDSDKNEHKLDVWYVYLFAAVGGLSVLYLIVKMITHSKRLGSKKKERVGAGDKDKAVDHFWIHPLMN